MTEQLNMDNNSESKKNDNDEYSKVIEALMRKGNAYLEDIEPEYNQAEKNCIYVMAMQP